MSDTAITVDRLGKLYQIGAAPGRTLREQLTRFATSPLRAWRRDVAPSRAPFWALKDVSFDVQRGDVVGIIGRNGAGKSTLLRILSRITEPSRGSVELTGRIASLLEVGTGFHGELTGRENVFLNGAILGMTQAEIRSKFDEIVAFSGVERFIDTAVKHYSSGMYLRLAFAVAAHLESEILIVDEVLAVGDLEFQQKCLGKMRAISRGDGRTVLFVSHNLAAIQTLCSQALYLKGGELVGHGPVDGQLARYSHEVIDARTHGGERRQLSPVLACDQLVFSPNPVESGDRVTFVLGLSSTKATVLKELAILLYSPVGVRVAILDLRSLTLDYRMTPGKELRLTGTISRLDLVEGDYSVGLYINGADLTADFLDLSMLSVVRRTRPTGIAPYSTHDRGLVELEYEFALA